MKKLISLIIFLLIIFANQSWAVSCDGWDSDTGAWVWGDCYNGSFDGWDSETNAWVWGDCEAGGNLDAWNSETGEWVWGDCDSEW